LFELEFRAHAIRRMYERKISKDEVRDVIKIGKIIEEYPDDTPFPSKLIIGWINTRPIHVVLADIIEDKKTIIITVYEPNIKKWNENFERKKSR
jgi:hypothetical protein